MLSSSPQPAVIHIVSIFRQIGAGEIRIPAFQREFVWTNRQIIELLESVKAGYPIGSLLLWYADKRILKIASSANTSFPDVEEKYPTSYVLDGMQRLSSLYGVFHFGQTTDDARFDVFYDLEEEVFIHRAELQLIQYATSVPLSALFSPRQLLEQQARISEHADSDRLIDELLKLQAAFQDYMLPVVSIRGDDVTKIVGIFEKINSTGTALDTVDFMRAITWSEDFDLTHELGAVGQVLLEKNFGVSDETIIKCIGLILGIQPSAEDLLRLRSFGTPQLTRAFSQIVPAFDRMIEFVARHFGIQSSDYIPYEGQILVLFKAIGLNELSNQEEAQALVRWFWATGFNESLRGKPDHYVVRAVEGWRDLISGRIRGLEPRLRISEADLVERRLIKGKALSAAFSSLFAVRGAESLTGGHTIDPASYMSNGDTRCFDVVFSSAELRAAGLSDGTSARIFANVILEDWVEAILRGSKLDARAEIIRLSDIGDTETLASQFISFECVEALRRGDAREFVWERAAAIFQFASEIVEPQLLV